MEYTGFRAWLVLGSGGIGAYFIMLLQGMLSFLLFAGALHVEANELLQHNGVIFALAAAGTILSTWLVGVRDWQVFRLMGPQIPLTYCLLLRALISPTDPVAVPGILKELKVSKSIETQMAGEALFNEYNILCNYFKGLNYIAGCLREPMWTGGEDAEPPGRPSRPNP